MKSSCDPERMSALQRRAFVREKVILGWPMRRIARACGFDESTIRRDCDILALPVADQEQIKAGAPAERFLPQQSSSKALGDLRPIAIIRMKMADDSANRNHTAIAQSRKKLIVRIPAKVSTSDSARVPSGNLLYADKQVRNPRVERLAQEISNFLEEKQIRPCDTDWILGRAKQLLWTAGRPRVGRPVKPIQRVDVPTAHPNQPWNVIGAAANELAAWLVVRELDRAVANQALEVARGRAKAQERKK